jgi:4-diphosphocytidyl-2-C-methyl-D-erythritol kinase
VVRFAYGAAAAGQFCPKPLAAARMYVRQIGHRFVVHAPAKVNLSLEVLSKRADGFHEIETLMAGVGVFDTLEFEPLEDAELSLTTRWGAGQRAQGSPGDLPAEQDNIVWRAVDRLRQKAGVAAGARIVLIKRIPSAAGLGGASSDAAAALLAASLAWQLNWSREQLSAVAAEIGSDVPFFLSPSAALCRGRGEQIEPVAAARLPVVIARPPVGLSTPNVYRACRPAEKPVESAPLREAVTRGKVAAAGRMLNNRLEEAAETLTPWIGRLRKEFARQGLPGHGMSGSGSSYFGLAHHARAARRIAARLRARRIGWTCATATLAARH